MSDLIFNSGYKLFDVCHTKMGHNYALEIHFKVFTSTIKILQYTHVA